MKKLNPGRKAWAGIVFLAAASGLCAQGGGYGGLGGAIGGGPDGDCIPAWERVAAQAQVDAFRAANPAPESSVMPPLFPFWPQGGNLFGDLFIGSFVDLDPTPGLLAWDCSQSTRDGHQGSDSDIRSFAEQAIGVPVFAAQDGVVSATQDGQPDMNTQLLGQPSNYVIISHPGGRDSWYWHLKNGSVAVSVGQSVKAGQQIGLTGSSGNSGAPHLHWQVEDSGVVKEPWAGACRPGASLFVNQPSYPPPRYVRDFAFSRTAPTPASSYPYPGPRSSNFGMTDGDIYFWVMVQNVPANQTYTVRFKRPDGVVSLQSGPWPLNNPNWAYAWWWFDWYVWEMHYVPGTWTLEFELNGAIVVTAPFDVFPAYNMAYNRAPQPITVSMDPSGPGAGDAIACRVGGSLVLDDLDWDVVRYTYVWKVDGQPVRTVTSAGKADMIPHHLAHAGQTVTCDVTASDGMLSAPTVTATATVQGLASNHATVSLSQGGVIDLRIDLGPSYSGVPYGTGGSLNGTTPGVTVAPGVVVPIVYDSWTAGMLASPNSPPYTGMLGTLDLQGAGHTILTVPGGLPAAWAGAMIWHASLALGSPWVATNAVVLTAVP